MIKILKEGSFPKPKRCIYNTKCLVCNCEFEFETEDCLFIEKRLNGNIVIDCPCCEKHINYKHENLEYREEE